jgi:hypothetical protein
VSPGAELSGQPPSPGPKPLFLCQPFVKAALVKGSFKTIVAPPKYVDVNEWVAINRECLLRGRIGGVASQPPVVPLLFPALTHPVFDFYHNLNHFYSALTEFCTIHNCPTMSAGHTLNFLWPDQNQRLVSLPAPTYIDFVMSWLQKLLEDEHVFPTKSGELRYSSLS